MITSIFYEGTRHFRQTFVFTLCIIAAILTFMNTLHYDFVHDDMALIVLNPSLASWDNIFQQFFSGSVGIENKNVVTPYFRPVLEIFNRLLYQIFGLNPSGFHLFNVIIHALNGFLVFNVLSKMRFPSWMALLTAIIFLVHPVQSQAVSAIAGSSNLITAFFILLSLNFFFKSRVFNASLIMCLAFYALALLSKEHAIVLPILVGGYVFFFKDRLTSKNNAYGWAITGLVLLTALYVLWRLVFLSGGGDVNAFGSLYELSRRILTIPQLIVTFLSIIIWPHDLHYYRSVDFMSPWVGYAGVLLVVVISQCVIYYKYADARRYLIFGWGWFILFLAPVLNIVPLINEYSFLAASEHFLYLPIIGIVIILLYGISVLVNRLNLNIRLVVLLTIFLMCLFSLLTVQQNNQWSNEKTLFQRAVAFQPQLGRVQNLTGNMYFRYGDFDKALYHYQKATGIFEEYIRKVQDEKVRTLYGHFLKSVYTNMGNLFIYMGDIHQSIAYYEKALTILGHFPGENNYQLYYNLSIHYHQLGQVDKASQYYKQAQSILNKEGNEK